MRSSVVPESSAPVPTPSTQASALAAAALAATHHGIQEREFRASVTSVDHAAERYQRALHVIHRRKVVLRWDPGEPTRFRKAEPPPDPNGVDPWAVDAEQLARESRVITVCPGCQGEKRRTCSDCAGSARRRCGGCAGSGRVPGAKGGTKNCPTCRARGDVKCTACKSGKVDCTTCGADGRVDAWLEVERETLTQVHSHPANRASALHEHLTLPGDFDAPPRGWVNRLVEDGGVQPPSHPCPEGLRARLDAREERLVSTRIQTFASDIFRVNYATARGKGVVEVAGWRSVVTGATVWTPLSRRSTAAWGIGITTFMAGIILWVSYISRHEWFAKHGHSSLILLPMTVAAFVAFKLASHLLLTPSARSASSLKRMYGGLAACGLVSLGAFNLGGPTARGAETALAAGDKARARVEAEALLSQGRERETSARVLDELHLDEVRRAEPNPVEQARRVGLPWNGTKAREEAVALLRANVRAASDASFKAHDARALGGLIDATEALLPEAREVLVGREALARAATCLKGGDFECAEAALDGPLAARAPAAERTSLRTAHLAALKTARDKALARVAAAKDLESQRQELDSLLWLSRRLLKAGEGAEAALTALKQRLAGVEEKLAEKKLAEKKLAEKKLAEELAARERAERAARLEAESFSDSDDSDDSGYSGGGRVHVRGYYRKNGTYVAPHTRSRPR
ncbi:hypothetical protein [Melittangium boletus]|uniref:hypothetical protein n=1 Tax=Melittangium boletus TaxID=83453 RepID=UPI003DA4A39B